jgi:hypothetical protein
MLRLLSKPALGLSLQYLDIGSISLPNYDRGDALDRHSSLGAGWRDSLNDRRESYGRDDPYDRRPSHERRDDPRPRAQYPDLPLPEHDTLVARLKQSAAYTPARPASGMYGGDVELGSYARPNVRPASASLQARPTSASLEALMGKLATNF